MCYACRGDFSGPNGDISWFKTGDAELAEYAIASVSSAGVLLFGRVTYELMTSYWPTPMAMKNDPVLAEGMNRVLKIVFSRTMSKAEWNNTRLVKQNMVEEIRKLKKWEAYGSPRERQYCFAVSAAGADR